MSLFIMQMPTEEENNLKNVVTCLTHGFKSPNIGRTGKKNMLE